MCLSLKANCAKSVQHDLTFTRSL